MTRPADQDSRSAWRSATILNLLLLALSVLALVASPAPPFSALTMVRLAQILFNGTWLLVLIRAWQLPRLRLSLAAFGLSPLVEIAQLPLIAMAREAAGVSFEAFLRQRVAMFIIAILAPRQVWVAVMVLGALAIETCLEYWIPSLGASRFGPYEPWATLLYFAIAIWIAVSRARMLSRELTLERELREAAAAARMTQMAQAVLDLANTPLQVIELQLTLLEERSQPVPPETAPIRRALSRLCRLSGILASYEPRADGRAPVSFESFDAQAVLRNSGASPRH